MLKLRRATILLTLGLAVSLITAVVIWQHPGIVSGLSYAAESGKALAAREQGVDVIMLEAAPIDDCGGNSRYTGGLMRVVYNDVEELAQIIQIGRAHV